MNQEQNTNADDSSRKPVYQSDGNNQRIAEIDDSAAPSGMTVNADVQASSIAETTSASEDSTARPVRTIKLFLAVIVAVILFLVGCGFGLLTGFNMGKDSYSAVELAKEQKKTDKNLNKARAQYQKVSNDYSEALKTIDEAKNSQQTIDDLRKQQEDMQAKIDALQQQYDQAKGQPIQLPAGEFIVGKEVPAGRYVISGSSNFQTYDTSGSIDINTILGNSEVGRGDYHGYLIDGYIIRNAAPATLTPVN